MIVASFVSAKSQTGNDAKKHRPKIKNANVIIVPDQKPVIIEKTDDPVVANKKQNVGAGKNNLPPGQAKKLYGAKRAKAFAPGQRKKSAVVDKNKQNKEK